MLTKLAMFLHTHGRRVLLVAVIAAVIAGAFGVGVAKHLSPYGADVGAETASHALRPHRPPRERPRAPRTAEPSPA